MCRVWTLTRLYELQNCTAATSLADAAVAPYRLRNDLKCVEWDVKPCSIQSNAEVHNVLLTANLLEDGTIDDDSAVFKGLTGRSGAESTERVRC